MALNNRYQRRLILLTFTLSSDLMNTSKTKTVRFGSRKFCGETFNHSFKLDWTGRNFTILGINFSCNLEEMLMLNFKDMIPQIEKELKYGLIE